MELLVPPREPAPQRIGPRRFDERNFCTEDDIDSLMRDCDSSEDWNTT